MKFLSFFTVFSIVFAGLAQGARAGYELPYIGDMIEYRAAYEDTFVHLARDYNLGFVEMRAANPNVDPWVPGKRTKLVLPTRHLLPDAPREGVVINLPEMRLYAFVNGDLPPDSYPIGVGREGLDTPIGTTTVARKKEGPIWRPTERMKREDPTLEDVYLPGPENPLGTHALYLGWPQYAIHGTNRPFGIGRRVSSGCIRLYPESITKLYESVPKGTKVTVVNQPLKLAWINDELFLEAHPDLEQAIQMEELGEVGTAPKLTDEDMQQIMKVAGEFKDRLRWPAIRTAVKERRGYPVPIGRRFGYRASHSTPRTAGAEPVESVEIEPLPEEMSDNKPEKKAEKEENPLEAIYEEEKTREAHNNSGMYRTLNP